MHYDRSKKHFPADERPPCKSGASFRLEGDIGGFTFDDDVDDVDDGNDNDGGYKEREKSGCAKLQAQQAKTNKSFFCSCAHTKRPSTIHIHKHHLPSNTPT